MLQVLLGQDSVRIKMSEARVGQYTRCKYDACSFVLLAMDRILSEFRFPRRASVSIPDANMTHAPSPACNGQDSVRIKVSEARVGQYIPDANMTHAPSSARTGFFQNIKMSEARVGQYTRCKYDACFKSCSDRILSELRCPRRASVSIPDANMTHASSPARTGFCLN